MGFRENLKAELEYKDMQVKELAAITGISRNTIANYLTSSQCLPNAESAVKIAKALNTSVESLVSGKTENKKEISFTIRKINEVLESCDDFDKEAVLALVLKLKERKH
ncbi:MAG: helix-turn-helix domain-containing protein [Treponemataceae bacterium]|nr:helix-turn-helix domain-containing protein [Treponemataceae bacterium]